MPDDDWTIIEFCVSGECGIAGPVSVDDEPGDHPFAAVVVDPQGQRIERSGDITTAEFEPNGEGCPPQVSAATLVIAPDGTVSTKAP